jgi:dTDP-4-dehydrorhamnose reductase
MRKIAVLGSTGMIGSGVTRYLSSQNLEVHEFNRAGKPTIPGNSSTYFNISNSNNNELLENLKQFDVILNLIGVIRHKINDSDVNSVENAIVVNSLFPIVLDRFALSNGIPVIQIGTDCVFSGIKGNYLESDTYDPVDIYGHSKVLGETSFQSTMNLRVSVVGKEMQSKIELMEWVLHHPHNVSINGFANHVWSGVTPLQLSRIIRGLISEYHFQPGTQHLVPANKISKHELIKVIASYISERELEVKEVRTAVTVDRSLSTLNQSRNMALWSNAGYDHPPTIQDMIAEYMEWVGIDCSH